MPVCITLEKVFEERPVYSRRRNEHDVRRAYAATLWRKFYSTLKTAHAYNEIARLYVLKNVRIKDYLHDAAFHFDELVLGNYSVFLRCCQLLVSGAHAFISEREESPALTDVPVFRHLAQPLNAAVFVFWITWEAQCDSSPIMRTMLSVTHFSSASNSTSSSADSLVSGQALAAGSSLSTSRDALAHSHLLCEP